MRLQRMRLELSKCRDALRGFNIPKRERRIFLSSDMILSRVLKKLRVL